MAGNQEHKFRPAGNEEDSQVQRNHINDSEPTNSSGGSHKTCTLWIQHVYVLVAQENAKPTEVSISTAQVTFQKGILLHTTKHHILHHKVRNSRHNEFLMKLGYQTCFLHTSRLQSLIEVLQLHCDFSQI